MIAAIALVIGLTVAGAILLSVLGAWVQTRTRRALEQVADELGLALREGAANVYSGEVDGVPVTLGALPESPFAAAPLAIDAALPRPLGFSLEVRRTGLSRSLRMDDRAFDRLCQVRTNDEAAARRALTPQAREALRELMKRGSSFASASDRGISLGVFDAHTRGARGLREEVLLVVRAARALAP